MTTTEPITATAGLDLHTWCRDRAHSHHVFETRELAMYPSDRARDIALVEWTIRCLGNPQLDTAVEALRQIAAQHQMELAATGTVDWLKTRVAELTAEVEQVRESARHYSALVGGVRQLCDQYRDEPPPIFRGPGLSERGEGYNAGTRDMARAILGGLDEHAAARAEAEAVAR